MDTRFLSLTGLGQYDTLIKAYVDTGLEDKAASTHTHSISQIDNLQTVLDEKDAAIEAVRTEAANQDAVILLEAQNSAKSYTDIEVAKITSGDVTVSKATSATYASNATNAGTASYATKAGTADNATSATYATTATKAGTADSASKLGTSTLGSGTQPIYLNAGVATTCSTYAGGTKLTVNGSNKGGSSAAIYAPTTGGTAGYILKSAGTAAPVWAELDAYTKAEVDTALSNKSASTHDHDGKYDAKGASTAALADAKTYTNTKTTGMATTAVVDSKISTHNSSTAAHSDIRTAIAEVKADVDAFFKDADMTTTAKETLKDIQDYISTHTSEAAQMVAAIEGKAEKSDLTAHTGSTAIHVSSTDRTNWNAAYNHSTSSHAPSNAEKNQNAFSNIKVGSTVVAADTTTDTIEFVGSNVTITTDATNDKITFTVANGTTAAKGLVQLTDSVASTSTTTAATPNSVKQAYDKATTAQTNLDTHNASTVHITASERTTWNAKASTASATTATAGLMSSADKTKLDGIAEKANNYVHPTTSGNKHIPSGGSSGQFLKWSADGTAVWASDNDTKYAAGTGIALSGTTFSNSGVHKVETGTTNGTIIVTTNGTTTSVPVKGLGGAAYKNATTTVTSGSDSLVTSGAVYTVIDTATKAIAANTSSISTLTTAIGKIEEISSEDIAKLFE